MTESRVKLDAIGFGTILLREFGRIVRIWAQTILPPAVTAGLYFIIFGSLIGGRIGQMGGYDYMARPQKRRRRGSNLNGNFT